MLQLLLRERPHQFLRLRLRLANARPRQTLNPK
jgi:hypothetical protein